MKKLTVLLFAALASVSGFLIKVPVVPTQPRPAASGWIHLQKLILPLFENVCEESTDPTIMRLAQEFTLDPSSGVYLRPDVIKNLQDHISNIGLMKKGEIFSEYNVNNLMEMRAVFEVLYFAKDFTTFYRAAAWARQNINCGLFVEVIYLTILHRRDTAHLTLPPPYELLPNYFIARPFIYKASALFSGNELPLDDTARGDGNSYIIDANYTSDMTNDNDESVLAYFREDIGLNTYYFLQMLKKCPWPQENSDINNRHGEFLYHMMKQLSARYSLEKYSHGLSDIDNMNWDTFVVPVYDPMLIYSNGDNFGYRTVPLDLSDNTDILLLQNIESNIATVVTHMRSTGYNKTQIINNLMEILLTGDRSYEKVAQKLTGKDTSISHPSVLDHYMTTLRDPVFWRINKLMVNIVDNALQVLPTYTRSELYFPGVELVSIEVKKMSTYVDYFQFDVTDALKSTTTTTFQVKIGQPRLNHKPFTVKLNITSLIAQKGLVKIYLGPKTPPGDLVAYKNMFVLLDSFECSLKKGINTVSRTSDEMADLADDLASFKTLRKNIANAEFGLDSVPLKKFEYMLGFPSRLILPKGTEEGLPIQIFVFVAPFAKVTPAGMFMPSNMEFNSEVLSPGFPFDLGITDAQLFELPNALVKEVLVTHKGDKTTNYGGTTDSKKWQQGTIDGTSQYNIGKKNEPFDYISKKEQYGKKKDYDYASKRGDYNKYKNKEFQTTTENIDTRDVVTHNYDNKVDYSEIKNDKVIEKGNFDNNINSDKKEMNIDQVILVPTVSDIDDVKMIGKVDLNKNSFFGIKDFDADVENTDHKYTQSSFVYDDNKILGKIDVNKDVYVDTEKKVVDFDKEVNIPTHKYTKDVNIDGKGINKIDLDKEVTVHVDTDYNKVDFDKIFPIHKESKNVNDFIQKDKLDTTKRDTEDDYKISFLDQTGQNYRNPSIYNYLVHPTYYVDYYEEKVFE